MQTYQIIVKLNKKQNAVYWQQENLFGDEKYLVVETNEPPIEGRANKKIIELLADFFGVAKNSIDIQKGFKSKFKTVKIK